jgi:hypothetical protein
MITHICHASLPADVTALVEHLAYCPETPPELASVCRDLVRTAAEGARIEARVVSVETPTETREMAPSDMAAMRGTGATYREIGARARVAPETVRRRIAKWKKENGL